jgi:hypothetical protein
MNLEIFYKPLKLLYFWILYIHGHVETPLEIGAGDGPLILSALI